MVTPPAIALPRRRRCRMASAAASSARELTPTSSSAAPFDDGARQPLGAGEGDDVGEIDLALGVVAADPRKQPEQVPAGDRHDPGVAQADAAFGRARVAVFDDRRERSVGRGDQTAIGAGVLGPHAQHRERWRPPADGLAARGQEAAHRRRA